MPGWLEHGKLAGWEWVWVQEGHNGDQSNRGELHGEDAAWGCSGDV